MSSQYRPLNWEQSRAIPVEALICWDRWGRKKRQQMFQRKSPMPTTYHSYVLLPPSTPTQTAKQKVLDSLSHQEFCGPDQLLCHQLALRFCFFCLYNQRLGLLTARVLLLTSLFKVSWGKGQNQYPRMLHLPKPLQPLGFPICLRESSSLMGHGLE